MEEGRTFDAVIGDILANDIAQEAARIERESKARAALRAEADLIEQRKTLTVSDLVTGVLAEGEKTLRAVSPDKEKKDAPVVVAPPTNAAFPPPPARR